MPAINCLNYCNRFGRISRLSLHLQTQQKSKQKLGNGYADDCFSQQIFLFLNKSFKKHKFAKYEFFSSHSRVSQ